jgi:hypothetical protein
MHKGPDWDDQEGRTCQAFQPMQRRVPAFLRPLWGRGGGGSQRRGALGQCEPGAQSWGGSPKLIKTNNGEGLSGSPWGDTRGGHGNQGQREGEGGRAGEVKGRGVKPSSLCFLLSVLLSLFSFSRSTSWARAHTEKHGRAYGSG